MKSNKEPVKLREKKLTNGQISLYLDCYREGKRQYEFLKLYLIDKPKNPIDRESNKTTIELAQRIKAKRVEELNSNEFNLISRTKTKTDLLVYYQGYISKYTKKDVRVLTSSLNEFKKFIKEELNQTSIQSRELTESLVIQFKNYLEFKFKGDTPQTYFNRFKKVIKQAVRDKLFLINPISSIEELRFKTDTGLRKDILSFEEIQKLANTHCPNSEVKRAFLFSCNTGLRHCDLVGLKWAKVTKTDVNVLQSKTNKAVSIRLNNNALMLLGERGKPEENVFTLPSFTGSIKSIRKWVITAEITKRVTWHSARHSFATNLLISKNNVKTVSDLLGHSSMKHTEKYIRAVKAMEEEAVNSLPNLKL